MRLHPAGLQPLMPLHLPVPREARAAGAAHVAGPPGRVPVQRAQPRVRQPGAGPPVHVPSADGARVVLQPEVIVLAGPQDHPELHGIVAAEADDQAEHVRRDGTTEPC